MYFPVLPQFGVHGLAEAPFCSSEATSGGELPCKLKHSHHSILPRILFFFFFLLNYLAFSTAGKRGQEGKRRDDIGVTIPSPYQPGNPEAW